MARFAEALISIIRVACVEFIIVIVLVNSVDAAQRNQGVLEIQIKDHRDAIGDFAKLIISIDKVSISPKPGLKFWQTGWKDLAVTTEPIDLTKFVGKMTARVYRAPLDAGAFDAFHLKIKSLDGVLKKNQGKPPVKNNVGPFNLSYQIEPRGETLIILDLVVIDMSDHPPRGYELELKGYELYTNGKLIEKIPPG